MVFVRVKVLSGVVAALSAGTIPGFLPDAQTVAFGSKTRAGSGGHPLRYTGTGFLNITGGNSANHWTIDANNHLVPVGTLGAAPPAFSGPYSLTVTEYSDSGKTQPTGRVSAVTVNMAANTFHIRWNPADSAASNQYRTVIILGTGVTFGDNIKCRDGVYGDHGTPLGVNKTVQFSGSPPSGPGVRNPTSVIPDSGWVTLSPENPGMVTIRALSFDGKNIALQGIRITGIMFERFNTTNANAVTTACISLASSSGTLAYSMFQVDGCSFASRNESGVYGDTVMASGILASATANTSSGIYVFNNSFDNMYNGVSITGTACKVDGNIMRSIWSDCVAGRMQNSTINWNAFLDKKYGNNGVHGDYIQQTWTGAAAGTYAGNEINGNVLGLMENRPTFAGGQGVFITTPAGVILDYTGKAIAGNIFLDAFANGILLTNSTNLDIANNTLVRAFDNDVAAPASPIITATGCTGRARNNIIAGTAAISGTTDENNLKGYQTKAALTAILAGPNFGATLRTVGDVVAALTPLAGTAPLTASPKVGAAGTGYFDYVNQTFSLPA